MSQQLPENRRILLIDDNPAIHEDFRKILGDAGEGVATASAGDLASTRAALFGEAPTATQAIAYDIESALQGAMGIEMARRAFNEQRPYAMAFVDMRMPPGLDGVQTIARLWQIDPRLEVVICTAYSDYSWDQIISQLGSTDRLLILKKPFDHAEVLQLACALTVKWQLARQASLRQLDLERMVGERTRDLQETNARLREEIDLRTEAEDRLAHEAMHDVLTDLPNRVLLLDRIERCLERAKRQPSFLIALLLIDLDEFKVVNDSLGHDMGDQLLRAASERLSTCLRTLDTLARAQPAGNDTMARLGGDEFVILLDDIHSVDDATRVAQRIKTRMSEPFDLNGHEVVTTVSIGIATNQHGYTRPEDLLRDADTALYRAKARGKARHVIFDHDMRTAAVERLRVENDLRKAIDRSQLFVAYQPIVCLKSGEVHGFEALLRWRHPQRGVISPVDFIPLAEETGLIIPLGRWVLERACRQLQQWRRFDDAANLTMSVNLSVRQFRDPDLIDHVDFVLARTQLQPRDLKLEITESAVMDDAETNTGMIDALRQRRLDLHMDDFGTGYSSLSHLHHLPVSALKIDRSFITNMGARGENAATVQAVITLAHNQGIKVIAEGVETVEQMAQLRAMHCDMGQGYHFARPLEAGDAEQLIRNGRRWAATG